MKKRGILILILIIIVIVLTLGFLTKFGRCIKGECIWAGPTDCNEDGPTEIISPIHPGYVDFILPYGNVGGSHVTPTDHQYWYLTDENEEYQIIAPADGRIVMIGKIMGLIIDDKEKYGNYEADYEIAMEHSCSLSTYLIHVSKLRDDILEKAELEEIEPEHTMAGVNIPIKKGEVIGWMTTKKFDFSVHNPEYTLPGFVFPKHYSSLAHKVHTVDPFDYIVEPDKSLLKEKLIRRVEPIAGKIDYDIEGKLIGNWFKENTKWYKGIIYDRYWDGHLAISYDFILPDQIRISMGDYKGKASQFGVKGNSPDPAEIDKDSGIIKYELVKYHGYLGPEDTLRVDPRKDEDAKEKIVGEEVLGVVLFQVLKNNKLKMEVFPGKTASEVFDFTENFRIYER